MFGFIVSGEGETTTNEIKEIIAALKTIAKGSPQIESIKKQVLSNVYVAFIR